MKKNIYIFFALLLSLGTHKVSAQVFPYSDDFESYSGFGGSLTSGGWTSSGLGFGCYLNRGLFNSKAATKNLFSLSTQKDSMTSKLIGPITGSSKLFFSYRFIDGASCNCLDYSLNPGDKLTVGISTNGTTFTNLTTYNATTDDGLLAFKTDSLNLASFAGSSIKIKFTVYRGSSANSDFKVDIDNVKVQDTPLNVASLKTATSIFSVYPNPASNLLSLKLNFTPTSDEVVTLSNYLGEVVFMQSINKSATSLNLGKLSSGIYSLSLTSKGAKYQQKVVIE